MFCKECGAEIPDDSKHCSECGAKLVNDAPVVETKKEEKESFFNKNKNMFVGCCIAIIVIFLLVGIASFFFGGDSHNDNAHVTNGMHDVNVSESDFKKNCTAIDYAQLTKNSDKYFGNRTVVSGTVLQITEKDDGGIIRLATKDSYDDVVAVFYSGTNDVVDGDQITVYGYVYKDYTYKSQANMQITIPCIDAKYIEKSS